MQYTCIDLYANYTHMLHEDIADQLTMTSRDSHQTNTSYMYISPFSTTVKCEYKSEEIPL